MKIPFFRQFHPGVQLIMLFTLTFLGFVIANTIVYVIARFALGITQIEDLNSFTDESIINIRRISMIAAYLVAFIAPALFFSRHMELENQDFLFARRIPRIKIAALIIFIFILCFPVINFLHYLNIEFSILLNEKPFASEESKKVMSSTIFTPDIQSFLINMVGIALLTAIGEELIFRSIIMRIFSKLISNIHHLVWFSAIFFSVMHFDIDDFLPRLFMGVVLGYIFMMTGNVWYCILLHFLNNGTAVLIGYLYSNHAAVNDIDYFGGYGYTLFIGAACLIAVSAVGFLLWKKSDYIDTYSEMLRR
jgi:uncharacterized protein